MTIRHLCRFRETHAITAAVIETVQNGLQGLKRTTHILDATKSATPEGNITGTVSHDALSNHFLFVKPRAEYLRCN